MARAKSTKELEVMWKDAFDEVKAKRDTDEKLDPSKFENLTKPIGAK
jgi:hypothetical protein